MRFRAPLAREAAHGPRALAMPGNGTRQRPERAGMGAQATGASARPTTWRSSAICTAPAEPFGMSGNRRGPCRPDHPRLAGRQAKPNQSPRELPAPLGAAQREASAVASGRSLVASQPSARSSRRARPFAASATVPIRKCARGGPVRPIRGRTDVLLLDQGHPACRRAAGPAGARCGRSRGCRRWRARPVRCWRPAGQLQRAGQDGTGAKARRSPDSRARPGQSGTKSPARSPQASAGSHAAGPRPGWRGHATSRKGGTAAPPARGPVAAATCASGRRAPAGNPGRERCGRCPAARHRPRAQPMRRGCGWRRRRRTRPSEDIHHSPLPTSRPPARKSPRSTRNPCGSSRTVPPQLEFLVIPLEVAEDVDHAQAYRKAGAPARLLHGSIKHSDRRWTMIASSLAKGIGP